MDPKIAIFRQKKIPIEYIRLYDTNEVPRLPGTTHIIFLGGPMSVNDEDEYPWLREEKEFIRRSVKAGQKVLGICLGAQLIASAHGAKVFRYVNETGWSVLNRAENDGGCFSRIPEQFHVFQLHGETFEIPYGGRLLAFGNQVRNQAFICRNALGLQFHLELTDEIIREWSRDFRKYQKEKIARDTPRYLVESNRLCRLIAEDFIGSRMIVSGKRVSEV
jgi:GMP synthase-like glutamine amidotransferase